jgi:hypothetical protein
MIIQDLNYLSLANVDDRSDGIQGGASVDVNTYAQASLNFAIANAGATALGNITRTSTSTDTKVYNTSISSFSSATAQASAYAQDNNGTAWARSTYIAQNITNGVSNGST